MDNASAAAYANPQLPPSLVVFSQAGDTLSDVLTMQRTFNPQVTQDNIFSLQNIVNETSQILFAVINLSYIK